MAIRPPNRMTLICIVVLASILCPDLLATAFQATHVTQIQKDVCLSQVSDKQLSAPLHTSPYVVEVFCEDALGSYIGIVRRSTMGVPGDGAWDLADRYWQEEAWAADVRSIAWIHSGKSLLVSTSNIYGAGAIFLLDLDARSSMVLFQGSTNSQILTIQRVDESKHQVFFSIREFIDGKERATRQQSVFY